MKKSCAGVLLIGWYQSRKKRCVVDGNGDVGGGGGDGDGCEVGKK